MGRFDNYLFHCSSLGEILTEPRSKKDGLSETCKGHLLDIWIRDKYNRTKTDTNKYIEKGLQAEEDGITLYSLVSRKPFFKNEELFKNEFICGTPDIIFDNCVRDIKCSWSMHTFFGTMHKAMNKDYIYQLNGYKALIGCDHAKLVYVLVNTPALILEQEKSKLRYKLGTIDPDADGVYQMMAIEIDRNGTFDDIPKEERWIEFAVPELDGKDYKSLDEIYERVKECREFLNKLS